MSIVYTICLNLFKKHEEAMVSVRRTSVCCGAGRAGRPTLTRARRCGSSTWAFFQSSKHC